jgi:hypothetical protein
MHMRASPFSAEGKVRLAYYGKLIGDPAGSRLGGDLLVAKMFKNAHPDANKKQNYFNQMEVQCVAGFLTKIFNEVGELSIPSSPLSCKDSRQTHRLGLSTLVEKCQPLLHGSSRFTGYFEV